MRVGCSVAVLLAGCAVTTNPGAPPEGPPAPALQPPPASPQAPREQGLYSLDEAVTDALEIIGTKSKVSLVLNHAELSGPMGYYYGYRYGYQQAAAGTEADA